MHRMKKILLAAAMFGGIYASQAQPIRTPQPSVSQTIKQDFALGSVEVNYSRPSKKGRTIFGDLVPYGAIWRTGANNATTISFSDEVMIGDKKVSAGKYGLLTIPGKSEWTVIITKQTDVTSPGAYKQDQDVARVNVPAINMSETVETFMIGFDNASASGIDMLMMWDKTVVVVPIKMEVDGKVMAQINNAMNKDNKPYFQSAMYYMENGKDLNQANAWFDKAIEQNPQAYWVYHQKANCLAKMGKKTDAITVANKSMEMARNAGNPDYVALNQKLIASLK
jgi:Holliday junction resolvase-like predicted endonuclease